MRIKPVIQGLAAVWLMLFVASFISLQATESDGSMQSNLARVAAFLTWQVAAFFVAALGAIATRYALARGAERVKLVGYVPLALSVFLVASFIALMGFRFYILPLFE
jgi:type IV secretory pathway VirB2 component (pilin)